MFANFKSNLIGSAQQFFNKVTSGNPPITGKVTDTIHENTRTARENLGIRISRESPSYAGVAGVGFSEGGSPHVSMPDMPSRYRIEFLEKASKPAQDVRGSFIITEDKLNSMLNDFNTQSEIFGHVTDITKFLPDKDRQRVLMQSEIQRLHSQSTIDNNLIYSRL
jgi:hypothetical protein